MSLQIGPGICAGFRFLHAYNRHTKRYSAGSGAELGRMDPYTYCHGRSNSKNSRRCSQRSLNSWIIVLKAS